MKRDYTKNTAAIYFRHATKEKWALFGAAIFVISASLIDVAIPVYFKEFFDALYSGSTHSAIIAIIGAIAVLKIFQWVSWRLAEFSVIELETRVMTALSNFCFRYLHRHSFGFFADNFSGALVKRVRGFTSAFESVFDGIIWDLLPMIVSISTIAVVLSKINIVLTVSIIAWIVVYIGISFVFARFKMKYDLERNEAESDSSALLADTIANNASVKLFNGRLREFSSFESLSDKVRRLRRFTWNLSNVFTGIQSLLMIGLELGLLVYALKLWSAGALSIGGFVLIQAYLVNIFNQIWGFFRVIRRFYEAMADANEMTEILVAPHEITDAPAANDLLVQGGGIVFKNVSFGYPDGKEIIRDFSMSISPGEKVAFVGPSGSGKSTIVKLILRSHDISSGSVEIDGQNIARVTLESLWRGISLVPQDPVLFHRSLMENIRYGRPEASDEEVIKASVAARCHDFISALRDGYDTKVGERGIKLSGGERQRVAIARAILKNSPILILDEATSSLDSESESLIQEALGNLIRGKTVIVIAHRLSTIKKMDRIIAIKDGAIAEEGNHKSLIARGGIYKALYEMQAEGFSD